MNKLYFCGMLPNAAGSALAQFVVGRLAQEKPATSSWKELLDGLDVLAGEGDRILLDQPISLLLMPVLSQNKLTGQQQMGTVHQYVVDALCPVRKDYQLRFALVHFLTVRFFNLDVPEDKKLIDDYEKVIEGCLAQAKSSKLSSV